MNATGLAISVHLEAAADRPRGQYSVYNWC